jgi:beta-lactamase superfamily II metal-dependent hydrolase
MSAAARALAFLSLLGILGSAAIADPNAYVIKASASPCLKLRPQPDTDAAPTDCLPPGTHVSVIESIPYWRKIHLEDGREGWVAKMYIEPASSPSPAPAPTSIPQDAWVEVHFVDVGQGDGIWIHTHDDGIAGNGVFEGRNIVIDGGPDSSDSKNMMLSYLRAQAHHDAVLDALFVSHPHIDHYPGAEGLVRHFQVSAYYDPGYPKGGTAYPAFLAEVRQETANGQPTKVLLGTSNFGNLDWGSEVQAEVLYSYPGNDTGLGSGNTLENNASIVLKLTYGNHSFLFMGDAEGKDRDDSADTPQYAEKILLATVPSKLKSTVLKIAHHGSETSSTLAFLQAVSPEIVVVSSGRKSFSGTFLPDKSTLRRYCCHNPAIRIFRTDQNDEAEGLTSATDTDNDHIIIRTNGTTLEVKALENGQPFQVSSCEPGCTN